MKKTLSHILFVCFWSIICAPVLILLSLHHVEMHHESEEQNCVEHCLSQIDIRNEATIPLPTFLKKIFPSILASFSAFREVLLFSPFFLLGIYTFQIFQSLPRKDYTALVGIIKSTT